MGKDSGNASDDYYQVHLVDDVLQNSWIEKVRNNVGKVNSLKTSRFLEAYGARTHLLPWGLQNTCSRG